MQDVLLALLFAVVAVGAAGILAISAQLDRIANINQYFITNPPSAACGCSPADTDEGFGVPLVEVETKP